MARFWYNRAAGALKVMKSDADDPATTPDTDYHKFLFNSNTDLIGYNFGVDRFAYHGYAGGAGFGDAVTYYPATNWRVVATNYGGSGVYEDHYFNAQAEYGFSFVPMMEVRWRYNSSDWVPHHQFVRQDYSFTGGGYFRPNTWASSWTGKGVSRSDADGGCYIVQYSDGADIRLTNLVTENDVEAFAVFWDLPGDDSDPVPPSGTPTTGQRRLKISPTIVKLSRPGYDALTATGRQLILDSDRIPAKVLATGEVSIPAGETVEVMINAAFQPLGVFTYVDGITRRDGESYFVPPRVPLTNETWYDAGATFLYRVQSDRVQLQNPADYDIDVIYIVFGDDDAGTTSGSGAVLTVDRGSNPGLRLMRPGVSSSPKLRDIILDTRAGYMPVLAEGYLDVADFSVATDDANLGEKRAADITFSNPGLRPFLKFAVETETGIIPPEALRFYISPDNGWNGKYSQTSIIARVESTYVRFYANPSSPNITGWTGAAMGTPPNPPESFENRNNDLIGLHYYIFGIPTSI